MGRYILRASTENDIGRIVEVYNSNEEFLINHVGATAVDENFVRDNVNLMHSAGFFTDVIVDLETGELVGVAEYKPDDTVYLTLFMIDSKYKGGTGSQAYVAFEEKMAGQGSHSIRLDVVDKYVGNPVGFWEKCGFKITKRTVMSWGNKKRDALVMMKNI